MMNLPLSLYYVLEGFVCFSPPRVRTKLCGQKDRHLFPDQQLTSVQLPSFRADDGLVLFSGYIPEDELKILRSREGISNT